MQVIRVYDSSRRPKDWSDVIRPDQYVVFASRMDDGAPCEMDGTLTSHEAATCALADSLEEAEAFARERSTAHPDVRYDIFDAAGRSRPPLLVVVHPSRLRDIEGDASVRRRNRTIAFALIAAAPVLIWIDWRSSGLLLVSTLIALNGLFLAARLLQLNVAWKDAERSRERPGPERHPES